jgi:cyclase
MAKYPFAKGLHDLGNGCHGYLQPDGGWGLSNAGLIEDQGETLLIDTLMDLPLTRQMLDTMKKAVPAAAAIGTLLNTHSNPDHTFGNQLVEGAVIISSDACLDEMKAMADAPKDPRGHIRFDWQNYGDAGKFFSEVMWSRFSAKGFVRTLPSQSFSGEHTIHVGAKEVRFVEVGPAHTKGDVVV